MVEINLFIEHHQFTELMQPKQPAGKRDAWPRKGIQKDPLASESGLKTVHLLEQRVCALDGRRSDRQMEQDPRRFFR
jgi:hypothetical protein